MHPSQLAISDFTYTLPESRIAAWPLEERDASKLLVFKDSRISEDVYRNIAAYFPGNALLVFNNTKVVEARLLFHKATGGVIEIFCLEPHEQYRDITTAMQQEEKVYWKCLVGGASKWKSGQVLEKKITFNEQEISLFARYVEKKTDHFIIELSWTPSSLAFATLLHFMGAIPLPPYIKREAVNSDAERYQTIYAQTEGSVAAPTAGLHFTPEIFSSLDKKNIRQEYVTLHVGAGTFKPVKAERMEMHEMHAEFLDVSYAAIKNLLESIDQPVIAVGTTSLRTIESLYWIAVKILRNEITNWQLPEISQWECYELEKENIPVSSALTTLLEWMKENKRDQLIAKTQIIIAPGYKSKIASALITNFHQPGSTLLLLVAALVGESWKNIYQYAIENNFRFLSYGDGCLLFFAERKIKSSEQIIDNR